MNDQEFRKKLEEYVGSSSRKDQLPRKDRLSELESSSIIYFETKNENDKEMLRIERIIIELDARLNRLEDPLVYEALVGEIVLKKIGAIAVIIGVIGGIVALIVNILK